MIKVPCRSKRSIQLLIWLTAGLLWAVTAFSCGSGNGTASRTEDLPPVVFLANKEDPGVVELYVSLNGGVDIEKLSGAMVGGGNVVDFQISPDGMLVAYVADQRFDGTFELFVSPADGIAPPATPVSGPMAGTGIAVDPGNPGRYSFDWSSDSQRIAYRATQSRADNIELYTVRANGTENVKLHPDFTTSGQNVVDFAWAPNSSRVAYTANQTLPLPSAVELYTTRPNGIGNVRVSADLVSGGNVDRFVWAPNSTRIAYRADQTTDGQFELFVTQPGQAIWDQVSLPLAASGYVRTDFAWAPNSSRLAYRADYDIFRLSDRLGLYTGRPDGTEQIIVSGGMPVSSTGVIALQWAPDSSLLTYVADQVIADQFDLFQTTPDNATPLFVRLSEFRVTGGDVTAANWSPSSSRVAYIADQNVLGFSELFTAFRSGAGLPQAVSNLNDQQSDVLNFAWSPDSSLIAFQADQDVVGVFELYTATPTGTVNYTISSVAATVGQVQQYLWEPAGAGIGYIADQDMAARFELYLSLPDGSDQAKVSGAMVVGGDVLRFAWVP